MYNGYLISIGGVTIPNSFIDRSSWRIVPFDRRVVDSFYDVTGEYHEYLADHNRVSIQFTLNQHKQSDHATFIDIFDTLNDVSVTYFNDGTQLYSTGIFKIAEPEWRHKRTFDGDIWYNDTTIKLVEY